METTRPVSSSVSLIAASSRDSPGSKRPAGWFKTLLVFTSSSSKRYLLLSFKTVATTTCGFQIIDITEYHFLLLILVMRGTSHVPVIEYS
jgi:hypothetical protein